MPRFEPNPGEKFSLNGNTFQVMEHPSAPSLAYAQEGRKAVVYQVVDKDKKLFAWKVFKQAYRLPALVGTCQTLRNLINPGLEVCERTCVTSNSAPELIKKYPDLEYSILMPWVEGRTWFELVLARISISKQNSLVAARNVALVLANLEKDGFAHCDIAGANLIVNPKTGKVNFVDVEDMFGPEMPKPVSCPRGTIGYQHSEISNYPDGQWRVDGDRFSAAIILGEILCWYDENIRSLRDGEHFFGAHELQSLTSPRYKALERVLGEISPELLDLFKKVWYSKSLSECPKIESWHSILTSLTIGAWKPIVLPPVKLPFGKHVAPKLSDTKDYLSGGMALARPHIYPIEPIRVDQKVTIRWSKIEGAGQYELQCSENDLSVQEGRYKSIYCGSQTFFETIYHTYGVFYYRVRSLTESNTSAWSPVEGLYVYPLSKPAVPKILPIYNLFGDRSFQVKWTAVTDAQWYEVEEITGNWPFNQNRNVIVDGSSHIKGTQVLVIGRKAGLYYYRVRAYNYCGFSEYSSQVLVEVKSSLSPNVPQILKIDNPGWGTDYTVTWGSISGASGYILFESQTPEIEEAHRIYQGPANKFEIANKEHGNYYYSVVGHDSQGVYDFQFLSGWTSTKVVLQTPVWHVSKQVFEVQSDNGFDGVAIQMIWNPVKFASRYKLSWIDEMGMQHIDNLITNTCMIVRPEGEYEFQVCAISDNGVASSWSSPIWIIVMRQKNSNFQIYMETK